MSEVAQLPSEPTAQQGDSPTQTNSAPNNGQRKLEAEELKEAVRKQIEFYFSPQNLASDAFLVAHMKRDLFVSLELIASFKILKALTTDMEVIKKAISDSKVLQLDETGTNVRPTSTSTQRRTTIIARDVPEATIEEVMAIFSDDLKPKQIRPDVACTWYFFFEDEAQTMRAYDYIRTVEFKGEPLRVRIKTETIVKSAIPTIPNHQPFRGNPIVAAVPHYQLQQQPPFGYFEAQQAQPFGGSGTTYDPSLTGSRFPARGRGGYRSGAPLPPSRKRGGMVAHSAPFRRRDEESHSPPNSEETYLKGNNSFACGRGRSRRNSAGNRSHEAPSQFIPTFNNSSFPHLPSLSNCEVHSSGYEGDFIKYSKQTVIDVFNQQAKTLEKPGDLPTNCVVALSTPNTVMELTQFSQTDVKPERATSSAELESQGEQTAPTNPSADSIQDAPSVLVPSKSFAEVAITAKDIKTPEKKRKGSFSSREKDPQREHQTEDHVSNKQNEKHNETNTHEKTRKHEKPRNHEKQRIHDKAQDSKPHGNRVHHSQPDKRYREKQPRGEKVQKKDAYQRGPYRQSQPQAKPVQEVINGPPAHSPTSYAAMVTKKPSATPTVVDSKKPEQKSAVAEKKE